MRRFWAVALLSLSLSLGACGDDDGGTDSGPAGDGGPGAEAGPDLSPSPDLTPSPDVAPTPDLGADLAGDLAGEGVLVDTGPSFGCFSVTPPAGNNSAAVLLTLEGYDFDSDATVTLVSTQDSSETALAAPTLSDTDSDGINDRAEVEVPAAQPQGLYEVRLDNPSSGLSASCGYYISTTESPPTVTEVVPDTAWEGDPNDEVLSDQPLSIAGSGFVPVPAVRFVNVATKRVYQATTSGFISASALTSVCPSESLSMPVGDYYVDVVNPSQLTGRWMVGGTPGIFKVTATPPPIIDDVSPIKVPANAGGGVPAVSITVTGDNFDADARIYLLLPDQSTVDLNAEASANVSVTVNPSDKDTISFVWDNSALVLPVGIYPLRLINPDLQYDTFFSLVVENAAPGKLNADTWTSVSGLQLPRERHASVAGFDVFGNSFIYTVGGTTPLDPLDSRPRQILDSTELVEVDVFGSAAASARFAWQLDPNLDLASADPKHDSFRVATALQTPRSGHTLVRAGRWLYAIGGAEADSWDPAQAGQIPALSSVERARILGYETMPNLSLPSAAPATLGLPWGSWYYRVSAVTAQGESLPSREVVALNASGVITLKWLPVTGATSYLIYRSPAGDGRAGSTRLLATGVTATSFTDDGQGALAPAPGRLAATLASGGSLGEGTWRYRVTATVQGQSETVAGYVASVTTVASEQTVALSWKPIPNATYSLYRSETADGDEQTYLLASGLTDTSYSDDGSQAVDSTTPAPDGTPSLPTGSISYWETLAEQLNIPREGADAVVVKAYDGDPGTSDEPSYIFVVGGRTDNATNTDYLRTSERAQVDPETGALSAWSVMEDDAGNEILLNVPRAFFPLLTTQGRDEIPSPPPPPAPPCPDNDGDGYTDCACGGTDCNDGDDTIYPGAPEICGDGIDQDCDAGCGEGTDMPCSCTIPDADGDGYDSIPCGGTDCNDDDDTIYPGAPEICGDGIDQDCDGEDDLCPDCPDADGDGFQAEWCGGTDCNDNDATICPDNEQCPDLDCDGIDQNCDGMDMICFKPQASGSQSFAGPAAPSYRPAVIYDARQVTPVCRAPEFPWYPAANGPEEAAHLVVVYGDSSYVDTTKNQGLKTAEVALVRQDGTLSSWTLQSEQVAGGTTFYGNDGLLYSEFVFSFQGVLHEDLGVDPPANAVWNNAHRFLIDPTAAGDWTDPVPATFLYNLQPADAPMEQGRVYLSVVRLNAYIFGIAGNTGVDGTLPEGPIGSVERIKQ